ncbi:hypothetical protein [Enterococcus sp.]|uniref:hypothetical protein n=1 Tax=Enterococcus sp. TaxID=35783 RepID=UPI00284B44B5|nr:hypothetical protein [Enterococcus sp.]MDR3761011.1 hypothetical protein [Enterococcus sp.]
MNNTTVNRDGSYVLPKGVDRSWFEQIKPNAKEQIDAYSSNAFLELYQQVEELMNPLKSGKTENMKRLDQLLALYPKALVDKLMKNDEFWMLADKLPSKAQTYNFFLKITHSNRDRGVDRNFNVHRVCSIWN